MSVLEAKESQERVFFDEYTAMEIFSQKVRSSTKRQVWKKRSPAPKIEARP
jgi:hypothetical protein